MTDQYFRSAHVRSRLRRTLGAHADTLITYLATRGHPTRTVQGYLQAAEHFARWWKRQGTVLEAADPKAVARFRRTHLWRCCCPRPAPRRWRALRAPLRHLLAVLGVRSAPRPRAAIPAPALAPLLSRYEVHLRTTCGLAFQTRRYRLRYAREFLRAQFRSGPVDVAALRVQDVRAFVTACAGHRKPGTAQVVASSVRSFLRFLQLTGQVSPTLVYAVPSVAQWKRAHLPHTLSAGELQRLWAAFDRATARGRRDYAIALCLSQLGLRVSEVPRLMLDDVDWRAGVLHVGAGKGRRDHLLPLSATLVHALATYVRQDRVRTAARELFVRDTPPVGTAVTAALVRGVMRRAYGRARLNAGTGTHILRHTAATRLLHAGAGLKVIADLLRHRSLDTTAIYAKVDLPRLRAVALPWPEEWS